MLKSTLAIAALCATFSAAAATESRVDGDALRSGDAVSESPPARVSAVRAIGDGTAPAGLTGLAMAAAGLLVLTGLSRRRGF